LSITSFSSIVFLANSTFNEDTALPQDKKQENSILAFLISLLIVILQYNNKVMGLTKTEKFTDAQNNIAQIAKVFGHPARIAILQHLIKINSCICGDLVNTIGLAQPTISQHLKELKNIGIIKGNIEGTSVCYCINEEKWQDITTLFTSFLNQNTNNSNSCC